MPPRVGKPSLTELVRWLEIYLTVYFAIKLSHEVTRFLLFSFFFVISFFPLFVSRKHAVQRQSAPREVQRESGSSFPLRRDWRLHTGCTASCTMTGHCTALGIFAEIYTTLFWIYFQCCCFFLTISVKLCSCAQHIFYGIIKTGMYGTVSLFPVLLFMCVG